MEIKKFSVGSKVKLKTGGPSMTVTGYGIEFSHDYQKIKYNHVVCSWEEDGTIHETTYHVSTLEAVENSNPENIITP